MAHELVIEGNAFINNRFETCNIGIDNGKITTVKKILNADTRKRFSKQLILPAGVDVHVHFRDPGMTHKENFETGSKSALFGGISCVFDMPNTIPPTLTKQTLKEKINHAAHHSYTDFGVYAGIGSKNIALLQSLSTLCSGYKVFLGDTTESFALNPSLLPTVFQTLSTVQKPILFHAEDNDCLRQHQGPEHHLIHHHERRPPECEVKAINHILKASEHCSNCLHICHLSSSQGLAALKHKKDTISCGATPHHLLLSLQQNKKPEGFYKVNPPIRPVEHSRYLFQALQQGKINILESDHAPHTLNEKQKHNYDVPSGIPGVETMIPLFLSLAKHGHITFSRLVHLCSTHPADLVRIPKGRILPGNDADFMIIDLRNETRINSASLHSKAGWSPFEGWNAIFPTHLFLRGRHIIDKTELMESPGIGRHVLET